MMNFNLWSGDYYYYYFAAYLAALIRVWAYVFMALTSPPPAPVFHFIGVL